MHFTPNLSEAKPNPIRLTRVFPLSAPVACFPALDTSVVFLRRGLASVASFFLARHQLHVFCAWHLLYVSPTLASLPSFPALGTSCKFSRARHQLHVFPRLAPRACLSLQGLIGSLRYLPRTVVLAQQKVFYLLLHVFKRSRCWGFKMSRVTKLKLELA